MKTSFNATIVRNVWSLETDGINFRLYCRKRRNSLRTLLCIECTGQRSLLTQIYCFSKCRIFCNVLFYNVRLWIISALRNSCDILMKIGKPATYFSQEFETGGHTLQSVHNAIFIFSFLLKSLI